MNKTEQKNVWAFFVAHFLLGNPSFLPNPGTSTSFPGFSFLVLSSNCIDHLSFTASL